MRRKNRGFTLIELLVVIAIIGVLLVLLFPAIASTRERANGVSCISNLRQHGFAIEMYADDNGGEIPTVPQLENYIDDREAFICPRDRRDPSIISPFKYSYTTHGATPLTNLPSDLNGVYTEQVILVESDQAGIELPVDITVGDVTIRHNPLTYVLHLDGHVYGYTDDQIARLSSAGRLAEDRIPGPD